MAITVSFSDWYSRCQISAYIILLFIILCYASWLLLLQRFPRTRSSPPPLPPGPTGLPILGHLPFLDPELHTYFASLANTHGPIFSLRLGRKIGVIISSPSLAQEVLKDQDITFSNRDVPIAAKTAFYGGSDIVWKPYGPEWRMLRKVCVRDMLSGTTLDSVYDLRRKEVRRTVNNLWVHGSSPVNVGEVAFVTMMNVITNMLWGGGIGKEDLGTEFRHVVAGVTALLGKPNLSDFFPGLAMFDLQGVVKDMKIQAQRFDKIFDSIIDERLSENNQKRRDFLQVLLNLKEEGNSKPALTITHIKALLMDMVVGGTDTTSNSIEFALSEMINSPEVMKRAQQELKVVVGSEHMVEESHIQQLPYLHAIMKETLRLHATLPLLVPHCPSKSTLVGGYSIPEGSRVFINVWAIHRDPCIWEDPTKFDPERFTTGPKWDYNGNEFNYLPFSSGRRICAGVGLAERMFLFLLGSLVHSFEWKVSDEEKLDIEEKFGIVLKKKNPLMAIPTPRLSNQDLYH